MIYYLPENVRGPGQYGPLSPGRRSPPLGDNRAPTSDVCTHRAGTGCTQGPGGGPGRYWPCYPSGVPTGIWTGCPLPPARPDPAPSLRRPLSRIQSQETVYIRFSSGKPRPGGPFEGRRAAREAGGEGGRAGRRRRGRRANRVSVFPLGSETSAPLRSTGLSFP